MELRLFVDTLLLASNEMCEDNHTALHLAVLYVISTQSCMHTFTVTTVYVLHSIASMYVFAPCHKYNCNSL